jgi:hypothetical protein
VEALDKSKADISAVKDVLEKVTRLEQLIDEEFSDRDKSNTNKTMEEEFSRDDDDIDPEELKD